MQDYRMNVGCLITQLVTQYPCSSGCCWDKEEFHLAGAGSSILSLVLFYGSKSCGGFFFSMSCFLVSVEGTQEVQNGSKVGKRKKHKRRGHERSERYSCRMKTLYLCRHLTKNGLDILGLELDRITILPLKSMSANI